jgi:hypothetical protein
MKKIDTFVQKAVVFKNWIIMSRKRLAAVSSGFVVMILCLVYLIAGRSYSLSAEVTHSFYTIPEKAVTYFEILDPQQFYSILEKSKFGKSFLDSQAWQKLSGTPEFQKLSNLLYFIELKAGNVISYKDLPSFFGGSVGFAKMENGSFLVVAKSNIKSRLGLSLMTAFKGKKVEVQIKKDESAPAEKRKLEGVTESSYTELFDEQKISFANLEVTRINVQNGYMFLVMVDDYVFISDNEETLKESLSVATNPSSSSFRNSKGMREALSAYESRGQLFFYADAKKSFFAPVLSQFSRGDGTAAVLYADAAKNISGDIFAIGYAASEKASVNKNQYWEKIIPSDAALTLYSSDLNVNDSVEKLSALGDPWKGNSEDFFKDANLDLKEYFGNKKGIAAVLHGADLFNKKFYPQFSIGYNSDKKDNAVYSSIFKNRGEAKQSFQGTSYNVLKNTQGRYYIPAWYYDKAGIVSSSRMNLEKFISAGKGNRPVVADDSSYALLGDYAYAPNHIVINIPKAVSFIRQFYIYGGERSGKFTKVTVDRDIMPLAEPLKSFETLHIALGAEKTLTGKIVLTDAAKQ